MLTQLNTECNNRLSTAMQYNAQNTYKVEGKRKGQIHLSARWTCSSGTLGLLVRRNQLALHFKTEV